MHTLKCSQLVPVEFKSGSCDEKHTSSDVELGPDFQVIPENDQNTSLTNQKTAGSKLERTSWLMFYGCLRHLTLCTFSGDSHDLESPGTMSLYSSKRICQSVLIEKASYVFERNFDRGRERFGQFFAVFKEKPFERNSFDSQKLESHAFAHQSDSRDINE